MEKFDLNDYRYPTLDIGNYKHAIRLWFNIIGCACLYCFISGASNNFADSPLYNFALFFVFYFAAFFLISAIPAFFDALASTSFSVFEIFSFTFDVIKNTTKETLKTAKKTFIKETSSTILSVVAFDLKMEKDKIYFDSIYNSAGIKASGPVFKGIVYGEVNVSGGGSGGTGGSSLMDKNKMNKDFKKHQHM